MDIFHITDVAEARFLAGEKYYEFFSADTMSLGLYALRAGEDDPQRPHTEDEIYYVVGGEGRVVVGDDDSAVEAGDVVFVGAGVQHYFYDIKRTLTLLVVFAPPRRSRAGVNGVNGAHKPPDDALQA